MCKTQPAGRDLGVSTVKIKRKENTKYVEIKPSNILEREGVVGHSVTLALHVKLRLSSIQLIPTSSDSTMCSLEPLIGEKSMN